MTGCRAALWEGHACPGSRRPDAGKTCYLAALYGFRASENGSAVAFADEQTIDYLADKWDHYLAMGQKPRPTALAMPSELRCHVKTGQRVWQVALRDYAGELVQRKGPNGAAELRRETREWLTGCNAILFFLDITEPEQAIRERLNELDLLLTELHKLSADGNTIARPLSLVLTKWDSRPGFDVRHADPGTELEKAHVFLKNDPVYRQFHTALQQSGDRVAVFPVSAFGSHRHDNHPPHNGPQQAFNIHAPLVWSLTKSEEMIGQKAQRQADQLLDRWWPRYGPAIGVLRQAKSDYRLNRGDLHERLTARLRHLRWRLWRRRIGTAILAATACTAGLFTALFLLEKSHYNRLVEAYRDAQISARDLKSLTDAYLSGKNPFRRFLRHDTAIQDRHAQWQEKESSAQFEALSHFRDQYPSETDAAQRRDKDQEYLELWEGSQQASTVASWRMEDSAAADKYKGRLDAESRYLGLLADVAAMAKAGKYVDAQGLCRRFVSEWPESSHRPDVDKLVDDLENEGDDYDWGQVLDFVRKEPNGFAEILEKVQGYLGRSKHPRHQGEAEALLPVTQDRWDRALYEQIRNASHSGNDANAIESVQRKATAYISGTQPGKRMKAEVQRWLDWYNNFQAETDYYIEVRSMDIPAGSDLDASNPCCCVEISLNGRTYSTGWAYGKRPVYRTTLGPYRFKWGQQGTFSARIEKYSYFWWNSVAELPRPLTDDRFILGRLNGPVAVRDRSGRDIIVYVECETAKQPELAAYGDR